MRRIAQRKQFRADLKRLRRLRKDIEDLIAVVEMLAEDGVLPPSYRAHKLSREWAGVWECHIEANWLLIYRVARDEVLLIRTGTHDDLFA